ncbi:MAG: hypothetical protein KJO07_25095, partial [Deltaproteobacteria bacterium]|nr:hypothetical protein [Deltaproteobacteria bacterium]
MLIQAYDVRIFRCGSCGGPVQAGAAGRPRACQYCGADTGDAQEAGAFSHDIRVLACDGCAAPLGVPISGGTISCEFCQTTTEIVARRELPLGSGGRVDDPERVAILRSQDRPLTLLGAKLGRLMRNGGLVDDTADAAESMWKANRSQLRA